MKNNILQTQLAVIGSGPGGYTAAFRAADLGINVTLIDKAIGITLIVIAILLIIEL